MWWILILATVVYIIYLINKDNKEEVKTHVTNQGGMLNKYNLLVEYFTTHPSSKITKVSNDGIEISSSTVNAQIDYVGGKTEIYLKAYLPLVGHISNKWNFPKGYPQIKMIEEIENYLNWQVENMEKISGRY